ncbi:DUF6555 family protein [Pseudomonas avellanae]|uniref:Uncharacterized protein n=1 Tax=Pseudomonas avellanae TaxID=46257 RepID=A0A3M5TIZ5_9PSED|nr:DUF6555 family protein [Pseudomonas avellanae]RMU33543.1 hypothetical protein ALP32_200318 [Pseudomonas avellanae]
MPHSAHYRIDYVHNGVDKSFYVSAEIMSNAEAWHWAAVDSGVAQIPKYRRDRVQIVSKPLAKRHGIVQVQWSHA